MEILRTSCELAKVAFAIRFAFNVPRVTISFKTGIRVLFGGGFLNRGSCEFSSLFELDFQVK